MCVHAHVYTCVCVHKRVRPGSAGPAPALPSMMEMCTALLRVRGTLLRRGPCVMEGQLRLGTSPALGTTTGTASEPRRVPEPLGSPRRPHRRALTGGSQAAPA